MASQHFARPPNLLPYAYLSVAERDRRWSAVHAMLERLDLDALVVAPSDPRLPLLHGDARWISQLGGIGDAPVGVVVPRDGEPIGVAQQAQQWLECQPWLCDLREAGHDWSAAVAVVLRELPLRRRRVGMARLGGPGDLTCDGPSAGFVTALSSRAPRVEWVDVSSELDLLRLVKSPEELAFLEHAAAMLDGAFAAIVPLVRPGLSDAEPWTTLIEALCRAGGELPPKTRWAFAAPGVADPARRLRERPTGEIMMAGGVALTHAQASWSGYGARGAQSYLCGAPGPADQTLMKELAEAWRAGLRVLRPGASLASLERTVQDAIERNLGETDGRHAREVRVHLRGCGLGGDLPRRAMARYPGHAVTLPAGACLGYSLSLTYRERRLVWGAPVAITPGGARQLGQRQPELLDGSIGAPSTGAAPPS